MRTWDRRGFLKTAFAAGTVGVAGCSTLNDSGNPTDTPAKTPTETDEPTPTPTQDETLSPEEAGQMLRNAGELEEPPFLIKEEKISPEDIDTSGDERDFLYSLHEEVNAVGTNAAAISDAQLWIQQELGTEAGYPTDQTWEQIAKHYHNVEEEPPENLSQDPLIVTNQAILYNAGKRSGTLIDIHDGESPVGLSVNHYDAPKVFGTTGYAADGDEARRTQLDYGSSADFAKEANSCGSNRSELSEAVVLGHMGEFTRSMVYGQGGPARQIDTMAPGTLEDAKEIESILEGEKGAEAHTSLTAQATLAGILNDPEDMEGRDDYMLFTQKDGEYDQAGGQWHIQPATERPKPHYLNMYCD